MTRPRTPRPPSRLAMLRLRARLSQSAVAEMLGVDQGTISKLEIGTRKRRSLDNHAKGLASAYGVTEREIVAAWDADRGD